MHPPNQAHVLGVPTMPVVVVVIIIIIIIAGEAGAPQGRIGAPVFHGGVLAFRSSVPPFERWLRSLGLIIIIIIIVIIDEAHRGIPEEGSLLLVQRTIYRVC